MKKMLFLSQNWYFLVQKALIYYTFNKSHHNSFILLVANFRYVANFTFLTLRTSQAYEIIREDDTKKHDINFILPLVDEC